MNLTTDHWAYLHNAPTATGLFKSKPEDFEVIEELGYTPIGEGEHIYLWVKKQGLNTAYVAEHIAKFTGLPLRNVTYAGRKDKHAVTSQWFGVHAPGNTSFDWDEFPLEGCDVLTAKRHNKKLRNGVLKGNRFKICLRDIQLPDSLTERIEKISAHGVPNYFGQQRFGESLHGANDGNLRLAERMLQGEPIKNRNKRSMVISALRSWLFNEMVSRRISDGKFESPMAGDAMRLSGSNSFFIAEEINDDTRNRLDEGDIDISAPMWGSGKLSTEKEALAFEQSVASSHKAVCESLADLGLKQERRPIRLRPDNFEWRLEDNNLYLAFSLPSGSFATSILREIVTVQRETQDENTSK